MTPRRCCITASRSGATACSSDGPRRAGMGTRWAARWGSAMSTPVSPGRPPPSGSSVAATSWRSQRSGMPRSRTFDRHTTRPGSGSRRSASHRSERRRYPQGVPIERVFVAGAGLMGHGIGQVHATIGKQVTLYEPDLARAQAGRDRIAGNLDRSVAKGRLTAEEREAILARVQATDDLDVVRDADLVVEAVFEDLDVKRGLWSELDQAARAAT